ncbi:hypothetical protein KEU06_05955 [Pseudaminobacter sp. 19-2017]|uniref:DUF6456 domain-containing protein n=1 Tax=Pseudaminobacter soli (ex Zhang et al. 2022) TaxID=2831468 RepID=A0A942I797_9HYPH|nr:hypothetical protein [Pseudaminobacter soli]
MLSLLVAGAATVETSANPQSLLLRNGKGAISVPAMLLGKMASDGSIRRRNATVQVTEAGLKAMARTEAAADPFQRQHRDLADAMIGDGAEESVAEINLSESPLAVLVRLKGKDGRPFLTRAEFEAGERLRRDFTRGRIMPRLGANWEASVAPGRRGEGSGIADLTDAALAARMRVERALKAVGPELSGLLIDVCCFLKGLETVERGRAWPVRSAKMLLKTALAMLARHYNPAPVGAVRPRTLHWGAEDYRPQLG